MTLTETQTHSETRTEAHNTETATVLRILLTLAVLVAAWATSVALWGIPGLYIPALAMVPVCWVVLITISRG